MGWQPQPAPHHPYGWWAPGPGQGRGLGEAAAVDDLTALSERIQGAAASLARGAGGPDGAPGAQASGPFMSQLLRDLSELSAATFFGKDQRRPGAARRETEEEVNVRRARLVGCIPALVSMLPALPLQSFRAGCEKCVQALVNMLRSRDVKASVTDDRGRGGCHALLRALHARLATDGGVGDCNLCIKAARCISTLLWAEGEMPRGDLVAAVTASGLAHDMAQAAVLHQGHEFTLARIMDALATVVSAEALHSAPGHDRTAFRACAEMHGFYDVAKAAASHGGRAPSGRRGGADSTTTSSAARTVLRCIGSGP